MVIGIEKLPNENWNTGTCRFSLQMAGFRLREIARPPLAAVDQQKP
jgi:hypothetical protein